MNAYKKLLLVFSVFLFAGLTNAQNPYTCNNPDSDPNGGTPDAQALDKYWNYRYRLTHYFLTGGKPGSGQGMSIPADARNDGGDGGNIVPTSRMGWVDGPRTLSWYIETLAMEYKLLSTNHQNTDETVKELYLALHAVFRLDSVYVATWQQTPGKTTDVSIFSQPNPTFPGFGVMTMDDEGVNVKVAENDPLNNGTLNLTSTNTCNNYNTITFGGPIKYSVCAYGTGDVGPIDEINGTDPSALSVASKDDFYSVLISLMMVHKLVPAGIVGFSGHSQPYGYATDLLGMNDQLANAILKYIFNDSQLDLIDCSGNKIAPNITKDGLNFTLDQSFSVYWMWPSYPPLVNVAKFFNYPIPSMTPYVPPDAYLTLGATIFGTLLGGAALVTFQANPGVIWYNLSLCDELKLGSGCSFTDLEVTEMGAVMGNDGGPYDEFDFFGKLKQNGVCSLINAFGTWDGTGCSCSGPASATTLNTGWDIYYGAVHEILYNTQCFPYMLCGMQQMVYSAPYHGPFSHLENPIPQAQPPFNIDFTCSDNASCGWASPRRFANSYNTGQNGNGYTGNFNGLDYMMMFDLYCLISQQRGTENETQIDNASNSSFLNYNYNNPGSFSNAIGYPDYYPSNYLSLDQSSGNTYYSTIGSEHGAGPFTIYANGCSPIIVNQLTVATNTELKDGGDNGSKVTSSYDNGALILDGGAESYIDLNPTEGPIKIQGGSYFDAICNQGCCSSPAAAFYTFQPDPYTDNLVHLPYQKNLEFDTAYIHDGIVAYPNPFQSITTINFSLQQDSHASIYLSDIAGRKVKSIANGYYTKGTHTIEVDGNILASGNYLCVLETNSGRKVVNLVKTR